MQKTKNESEIKRIFKKLRKIVLLFRGLGEVIGVIGKRGRGGKIGKVGPVHGTARGKPEKTDDEGDIGKGNVDHPDISREDQHK